MNPVYRGVLVALAIFALVVGIIFLLTGVNLSDFGAPTEDLINAACKDHGGTDRVEDGLVVCRDGIVESY